MNKLKCHDYDNLRYVKINDEAVSLRIKKTFLLSVEMNTPVAFVFLIDLNEHVSRQYSKRLVIRVLH